MSKDNSPCRTERVTRRHLLHVGAAGLPAVVAGCMGDGDPAGEEDDDDSDDDDSGADDGDDGDDSSTDPGEDVVWKSFASHVPQDAQFNPYNAGTYVVQGRLVHWTPLMQYHVGSDQWIPLIAEDWSLDGTTGTIQVADEFTWHNGDAVTAEDVATRLQLMYYMNDPIESFLSGPPVAGNGEVELSLENEVQGDIFWPQVTANIEYHTMSTSASVYGEFVDRFEDAADDEAIQDVQADLTEFSPRTPGDDVLGNGPFAFVEATEEAQIFELHEDYPVEYVREQVTDTIGYDFGDWPAEIAIDRVEFHDVGDLWAAYRSETLDGGADNAPREVYAEYPDDYHVIGVPRDEMWGLSFQYDDDIFGRRNVRKAFSHVIERSEALADQMFPLGDVVEYESGMTTSMTEGWVSDDVIDSFTDYTGQNHLEAAALLEEEGFTEEDGEWYTPDGDRFSIELRLPAYDDIVAGIQVVEGRLAEFGIETEFNAMEVGTFFGDVAPTGDFSVIATNLGTQPHPLFSYQANWLGEAAETNFDLTPEIPEVGDADGDSTLEVDIDELLVELSASDDDERVQEIIDTLAWTHNQDVPYVACAEKAHQYCVSHDGWERPGTQHEALEEHDPLAMTHTPWHFPFYCGAIRPE